MRSSLEPQKAGSDHGHQHPHLEAVSGRHTAKLGQLKWCVSCMPICDAFQDALWTWHFLWPFRGTFHCLKEKRVCILCNFCLQLLSAIRPCPHPKVFHLTSARSHDVWSPVVWMVWSTLGEASAITSNMTSEQELWACHSWEEAWNCSVFQNGSCAWSRNRSRVTEKFRGPSAPVMSFECGTLTSCWSAFMPNVPSCSTAV